MSGKQDPEAVSIVVGSIDEVPSAYAGTVLKPELNAATAVRRLNRPAPDELTIDALISALEATASAVSGGDLTRGEAMLSAQAHTLDCIFGYCIRRAQSAGLLSQYETQMRIALKAQSQCRTTWEALHEMKYPRQVAFVGQANIANGPQQINNASAHARNNGIAQTKLSELEDALFSNSGTPSEGSRTHPTLAPVGEVNRAENFHREGQSRPKRLSGRDKVIAARTRSTDAED